jgi:hypothetical protein
VLTARVVVVVILVVVELRMLAAVAVLVLALLKAVVSAMVAMAIELTHLIHLRLAVEVVGMGAVVVVHRVKHLLAVVQVITIQVICLLLLLLRVQVHRAKQPNGQLTRREMVAHK